MKPRRHRDARAFASDERLVERPAAGAAPTAFRIWAAGENMTDHGPVYFTARSADLLLAEQDKRGNLYSIDFDHLSLAENRPAEAGRAAGWHELAVRADEGGSPELWAVAVEWCPDVKAGLEEQPPRWRYFSPAYETDAETSEVISYLNTAICINPATHNNNQLASRRAARRSTMKRSALLAALKAMTESGDEDEKKAAAALYAKMGGDKAMAAVTGDVEGGEGGETEEASGEGEGESGGEGEGGEKKPAEGEEGEQKPDTTTTTATKRAGARDTRGTTQADAASAELAVRLAKLEAERAAEKDARERDELIAKNANRFTDATKAWAATQPIGVVRSYIKSAPILDHKAPQAAQGTRGATEGSGSRGTGDGFDAKLDRMFGIRKEADRVGYGEFDATEGVRRFDTMSPARFRATRAAGAAQKGNG